MVSMIRGMTVTLYERIQTGTDAFGAPIYTEQPLQVDNVLVAPAAAADITTDVQLYGKRAEYVLCIPKGDVHHWEDCRVDFFGRSWRVFGPPMEWMEENVPGPWNKQVKVERFA